MRDAVRHPQRHRGAEGVHVVRAVPTLGLDQRGEGAEARGQGAGARRLGVPDPLGRLAEHRVLLAAGACGEVLPRARRSGPDDAQMRGEGVEEGESGRVEGRRVEGGAVDIGAVDVVVAGARRCARRGAHVPTSSVGLEYLETTASV